MPTPRSSRSSGESKRSSKKQQSGSNMPLFLGIGAAWVASLVISLFVGGMLLGGSTEDPVAPVAESVTEAAPTESSAPEEQPVPAHNDVPMPAAAESPMPVVETQPAVQQTSGSSDGLRSELNAAIDNAIALLEAKEFQQFEREFGPRNESGDRPPSFEPPPEQVEEMMTMLRGMKESEIVHIGRAWVLEEPQTLKGGSPAMRNLSEIVESPTPGLGSDLKQMLQSGVKLLQADNLEQFVRSVYPVEMVRELSREGVMEEHLLRMQASPEMTQAMIRDLQDASAANPTYESNGNVALFTLPPVAPKGAVRTFKLELVEDNWRFFDEMREAHKISEQLNEAPTPDYTIPGRRMIFWFEKVDGKWRVWQTPEEVEFQ
ncbi:MAG: hypothetical protein R3C18_17050 [Planctomycetaceae bacterium]